MFKIFVLFLALTAVFADYQAIWSDDQLSTRGYAMVSLSLVPGTTCHAADICTQRIDALIELFDTTVTLRYGGVDAMLPFAPSPACTPARFDAQLSLDRFGVRIADRETGVTLWNSVLYPDAEFADLSFLGTPAQQTSSLASALAPGFAVFAAGAPLPADGSVLSLWAENMTAEERLASLTATENVLTGAATLPVLTLAGASPVTGAPVTYALASLADRPLSVARSADNSVTFVQNGGIMHLAIAAGHTTDHYAGAASLATVVPGADLTFDSAADVFGGLIVQDYASDTLAQALAALPAAASALVYAPAAAVPGSAAQHDAPAAAPAVTMVAAVDPVVAAPAAWNDASEDAAVWASAAASDCLLRALETQGSASPDGAALASHALVAGTRVGVVNTTTSAGQDTITSIVTGAHDRMGAPAAFLARGAGLAVACTGTTCAGDSTAKPDTTANTVYGDATAHGLAHRSLAPAQPVSSFDPANNRPTSDQTLLGARRALASGFLAALTEAAATTEASKVLLTDLVSTGTGALALLPVPLGAPVTAATVAATAEAPARAALAGAPLVGLVFELAAGAPAPAHAGTHLVAGALAPALAVTSDVATHAVYGEAMATVALLRNTFASALLTSRRAPPAHPLTAFPADAALAAALAAAAPASAGLTVLRDGSALLLAAAATTAPTREVYLPCRSDIVGWFDLTSGMLLDCGSTYTATHPTAPGHASRLPAVYVALQHSATAVSAPGGAPIVFDGAATSTLGGRAAATAAEIAAMGAGVLVLAPADSTSTRIRTPAHGDVAYTRHVSTSAGATTVRHTAQAAQASGTDLDLVVQIADLADAPYTVAAVGCDPVPATAPGAARYRSRNGACEIIVTYATPAPPPTPATGMPLWEVLVVAGASVAGAAVLGLGVWLLVVVVARRRAEKEQYEPLAAGEDSEAGMNTPDI